MGWGKKGRLTLQEDMPPLQYPTRPARTVSSAPRGFRPAFMFVCTSEVFHGIRLQPHSA